MAIDPSKGWAGMPNKAPITSSRVSPVHMDGYYQRE